MTIEFKVPERLQDIMVAHQAAKNCRDGCLKLSFRKQKAFWYGIKAIELHLKFWKELGILYPQTNKGNWVYSSQTNLVRKGDD